MSGTRGGSIQDIALSNSKIANNKPAGTEVGTISVTLSDGSQFNGTLTLSGPYAHLFTIEQTRDPYALSSISLDNSTLQVNPPVGIRVGGLSVATSDGGAFTGTLSVNDTAHFAISGLDLVTSSALTNGANYNVTITASDAVSTNKTLSVNFQLTVQAAGQVPGPLTSIASPAQTSSTLDVTWAPPNAGGSLDTGVHQIQYKISGASTYLNASPVAYVTPGNGSFNDASGAAWTLNAQGHPVLNGAFVDTTMTTSIMYLIGGLVWQQDSSGVWRSSGGGIPPTWTSAGPTSPLKLKLTGLTASATYNVRGYASNSAGSGSPSADITVSTSSQQVTLPSAPTGVTLSAPTSTTISVTWQTPAGQPAAGYIVQYKRAADANYTNAPSWLESINGTTYSAGTGSAVTGTSPSQTVAINSGGGTTVNGVADGGAATLGVYWAHSAYVNNTANEWYKYLGTAGSYTLVGTGAGADPRLTIPADTSFTQVLTGLTANTAYNVRVLAFNSAGNGPVSTVVNVTTPSGTVVGVQPPPQAAAAGFNTIVLNSDFNSPTEATGFDSGQPAFWWPGSCNTNGGRLIADDQFSIANSILSISFGGEFASSMSSARDNSYQKSTPSNRITTPNTHGIIYQYGYFEAKMRCNGTHESTSGNWWPSFWATAAHNQPANNDELELDFCEIRSTPTCGFWNWFARDGSGQGPYTDAAVSGGNTTGYPGFDFSDDCARAGLDMNGGWNIYGCLWSTTRLTFYWNSAARRDAGIADAIVGTYPTTTLLHTDRAKGGTGDFILRAANNGDGVLLILGGMQGANVQFDYVRVWQ